MWEKIVKLVKENKVKITATVSSAVSFLVSYLIGVL